jgi:hypothetical protein
VGGALVHRGGRTVFVRSAVIVLAAALAGTANGARPDTKTMVLRLSDLPPATRLADTGYSNNSRAAKDSPALTLGDFARWGRIMGYAAEFVLARGTMLTSRAEIFRTTGGADASLKSSFAHAIWVKTASGAVLHFRRIAGVTVGEDGRMFTTSLSQGGRKVMLAAVMWRDGQAKGELFLMGPPVVVNVAASPGSQTSSSRGSPPRFADSRGAWAHARSVVRSSIMRAGTSATTSKPDSTIQIERYVPLRSATSP